jgi:hypothetical protein
VSVSKACFQVHQLTIFDSFFSGKLHYNEMFNMLKNMAPPLGFGHKCPNRLAYRKLIRMNMPVDVNGHVSFTTTLFALIRENLDIKMRPGNEPLFLKIWLYVVKGCAQFQNSEYGRTNP